MKGIFSYDSKFGGLLNKIVDYMCLFLLWVLFSIPIITIGASTCAFYYTFNKVLIKERGYIVRSFIKAFKENFKQATGVFLLQMVICSMLVLSGYCIFLLKGNFSDIVRWGLFVSIVITYMWIRYWFPYISCIEDKTRTVLKNCWIIMMANLPWTLVTIVLFAIMLIYIYKYPNGFVLISAAYMALNSLIFNHILKKYMPPEPEEDDSDNIQVIEE